MESLSALPVAIDVDDDRVRRHVEEALGWQPVDASTALLVPPAVRLVDASAVPSDDRVPRVLLAGDDPVAAARAAIALRPADVVRWPDDRDALADVVASVLARARRAPSAGRVIRIGGAAGGVGTTTVCLAVAGIAAWDGLDTLAAVRDPAPIREVVVMPSSAASAPDVLRRATVLPGTVRGRVVRIADRGRFEDPVDPAIALTVVDEGVATDVDVLVVRPDASAHARIPHSTAAVVVVVGEGPVTPRDLGRVAGGRRGVAVPASARVARAAAVGRVPDGLPGTWLRRLAPVLGG
jgi:hypothetical protein